MRWYSEVGSTTRPAKCQTYRRASRLFCLFCCGPASSPPGGRSDTCPPRRASISYRVAKRGVSEIGKVARRSLRVERVESPGGYIDLNIGVADSSNRENPLYKSQSTTVG